MPPENDDGVLLVPIPAPSTLDSGPFVPAVPSHLALTPEKYIWLYSDVEWEEFVLEWATSLKPNYEQVMRSGGANDHGVDVAGFASSAGFDGEWDCYQCKHYSAHLVPSDAYPEMLKIVLGVLAGHYTWPRQYRFAAPKGYGTSLANLIHSPSKLKDGMVKELTKLKSTLVKHIESVSLQSVLEYIDAADFSIFGMVELHELVEQHARTRWHSARFGVSLPLRPGSAQPTEEPGEHEQTYIEKLIAAYNEKHPNSLVTPANAVSHDKVSQHYSRQRVSFYSAESLRLFARDSVPEGTFDRLQDEVFDGVVDIHDMEHSNGFERLHRVSEAARQLAITANSLLPVVEVRDRTGICHQLANDDRLSWCHASPE